MTDLKDWRSQGDSNPCFRRERATSWAARRWEPRPGCSYIGASGRTQVVRLARVLARARAGSPEFSGRSSFGAEIALLYFESHAAGGRDGTIEGEAKWRALLVGRSF